MSRCDETAVKAFAGADPKAIFVLPDSLKLAQISQGDQVMRRELAPFHFGINVGASSHDHGVRSQIRQHFRGFFQ